MDSKARKIKVEVFDKDTDEETYLDDVNYWISKNNIKEQDIISVNISYHVTEDYQGEARTTRYWTRCTVMYWG